MKTKISLSCKGRGDCSDGSNSIEDSENEWCTILLTQHIPQGAYIDVDEVKVSGEILR